MIILGFFSFVRSAVVNLKVLNDGLARHEATLIVPTMYVLHTVLTITGGELLYQTYHELEWTQGLCFGAGVAVSILGVFILAHAPPEDEEQAGWEETQSGGDYATLGLDRCVDDESVQVTTYATAEQTPPRLEPWYDDGQLWVEEDNNYEDDELARVIESAAAVREDGLQLVLDHASGSRGPRQRAGSAPRLTTTMSDRTASPEHDFLDQTPGPELLSREDEETARDRLLVQVDNLGGGESGGSVGDNGNGRREREGRGQRGHHRRMRSISTSPRERTAGRRDRQQGHSPGRSVRYVLVSRSGLETPQASLSSLSRTSPSPGAFELSLWRWSARVVPSPAGSPGSPTVPRSLAGRVESPSSTPAPAVAVEEGGAEALLSERDGRRLFGAGQSNDEASDGRASTEQQTAE